MRNRVMRTIIDPIWPKISDLAADLRVPYTTAASWLQRGRIPASRDLDLIAAAKARGFSISLEQIALARRDAATLERGAACQ